VRFYAFMINRMIPKYNKIMGTHKKELFADLHNLSENKLIKILEIGAGGGANFEYYPANCLVVCLEPKRNFEEYINKNVEVNEGLKVEFVHGFAEDMNSVADNSVDAVVATLVLCSVNDIPRALQEIHRILKPGGQFYYMEHVSAVSGTWLAWVQSLITPVWRHIADGCCLDRHTGKLVQSSIFTSVKQKHMDANTNMLLIRPHVIGVATK